MCHKVLLDSYKWVYLVMVMVPALGILCALELLSPTAKTVSHNVSTVEVPDFVSPHLYTHTHEINLCCTCFLVHYDKFRTCNCIIVTRIWDTSSSMLLEVLQ